MPKTDGIGTTNMGPTKEKKQVVKSDLELLAETKAIRKGTIHGKRYYVIDVSKEPDGSKAPADAIDELVADFWQKARESANWSFFEREHVQFTVNMVWPFISKRVWACISKSSPALKLNSGNDYVLNFSGTQWEMIDADHRKILVEHELEHVCCDYNKLGKPVMGTVKHDVEEFSSIINKYGVAWLAYGKDIQAAVEEKIANDK